jgi:hypothetical protein
MFRKIQDFNRSGCKNLIQPKSVQHIPDRYLSQSVGPGGRTLGRLGWQRHPFLK